MAEPTELPIFDENDTNTTPVTTSLKDDGFPLKFKAPATIFNSWFRNVYKWIEWFQEKFLLVDADIERLQPVDSVADLRALDVTDFSDGDTITVTGYYAKGDGGDRIVYFDNTSTDTDNNYSIFKPNDSEIGRWKTLEDGNIKLSLWAGDIETAIINIGSTILVLDIDIKPNELTDNLTIPSTLTLNFTERMVWSGAGGFKLTVESVLQGGIFRVFDSDFTMSITNPQEVQADWWGKDVKVVLSRAYASVAELSTIKLNGGTYDIGTNQLVMIDKPVTIKGHSGSINYNDNTQGSTITYSGTGYALLMTNASTLEDVKITGGEYCLQLGNDTGSGSVSWGGVVRNVMLTGASIAGYKCVGVQVGLLDNVLSQDNTGAGMLVSGANNTACTFLKCRWFNNDEEGILYEGNSQFHYEGCHVEFNGYEGIKNETTTLSNTTFNAGWIERNNRDVSRASGYYQLYLNNSNNDNIKISGTYLNDASTVNNTHIGFKGNIKVSNNTYVGDSTTENITFLGTNDTLFNENDNIFLNSGHVKFNDQNNGYKTIIHETLDFSSNVLLGAGFNNVPILNNITITNAGAGGGVAFNLSSVNTRLDVAFSDVVGQVVTLHPIVTDRILPTCALGKDLISSGTIGDYVRLKGLSTVIAQEVANIGTWTAEP